MEALAKWMFFKTIFDWIDGEIDAFRDNLLGEMAYWVGGMATLFLTIWILFQGYRIVTGQSRENMMQLVVNSLKWVLIVTAATTFAFGSTNLHRLLSSDMPAVVNKMVTGEEGQPVDKIDDSLQQMELAMTAIDGMNTGYEQTLEDAKTRAMWFTGVGVAGPSVVGGALLLMYKMAMALFVGLGPFFILSLAFDATKPMFQKWLWYGIGTMFSLGVMSFCVSMVSKLLYAVAASYAAQYIAAVAMSSTPDGVQSMAIQQGGIGLLMTVFLITVPPMAAAFFQGTLGQFSAYTQFGIEPRGGQNPAVVGPGGGYMPPMQPNQERGGGVGGNQGGNAGAYNVPVNAHPNRSLQG